MSAKAHAIQDYSFAGAAARPRRQLWIRDSEEPVVLPRGSGSHTSGALVFSAVLASALVAGAAYAVYFGAPTALAQAPAAAALEKDWQADPAVTQANVLNTLQGPARSASGVAAAPMSEDTDAVTSPGEVTIDDSAPSVQESLPQPDSVGARLQPDSSEPAFSEPILPKQAPALPQAPYPNPTTTPPDMVSPPVTPAAPPSVDADNPY